MLVLLPWLSLTHAHSGPGSHKLFHILTNAPLPTFHLMPCFSNFWALQILRQVYKGLWARHLVSRLVFDWIGLFELLVCFEWIHVYSYPYIVHRAISRVKWCWCWMSYR
ncbi:hypothetical protein V6Z11_D08G101800 [Gossypium hirsutum]